MSWPGSVGPDSRPVINNMNVNTNNMNTTTTESLTLQEQGQQLSVLGAFANSEQFQMAKQAAEMLASSSMVPTTYQNNPGSCFIALNTALRLRMDPLMIMQNLYVVQNRPSWSGQFAIALVNICPKFSATWFEYRNEEDFQKGVRMCAQLKTGQNVYGTWITPEMVKAEGWGKKWQTMPEQMYKYRAAAFFARTECPEALLGLSVEGEAEDMAGKSQPDIKPPLFKSREMPKGDVVEAEKVADSPRQLGDAEVPGKGDVEVPPPHIRLMEALSCTEEELNAVFKEASGGKVDSWKRLSPTKLEDCLGNLGEMQAVLARIQAQ
nr:MAG TPA: RecT protein [Bacteriophage sp.]